MPNVPDYSLYIGVKKVRATQTANTGTSIVKSRAPYMYDGYFPLYRSVGLPINALVSNKFTQGAGGGVVPPAPPSFSPLDIAGTVLWLDASDSSTLILSGSSVVTWSDKSGLNNTPITVSSGGNPSYNVTRQSITTGGGSYFSTPLLTVAKEYGFFIFQAYDSAFTDMFSGGPTSRTRRLMVGGSDVNLSTFAISWLIAPPSGISFTTSTTQLLRFDTTSRLSLNGGAITANGVSITSVGFVSGSATRLGEFNGEIMEAVVYQNVDLTAANIAAVEGYLAWKWGIQTSLPVGHPYRNAKP